MPLAVCFAPGTTPEYMAEWENRLRAQNHLDYRAGGRWDRTATNPSTGNRGNPITLTYSFVPDGVNMDGGPNVIFARMNQLFSSQNEWQAKFAQAFASWERVCGIHYIQVTDDGASWPQSQGVLGVRGDIRIGARQMDGPYGVLAYDYFPDRADMLLDSDEDWADALQNYLWLRQVVAHEHGHGIALFHTCPTDNSKLMEPFLSTNFDGPQHDDIRGGQRLYGDRVENNDNTATATRLQTIAQDTSIALLSVDGTNDVDFYKLSVPAGKGMTITVSPDGRSYLEDDQNEDGSCNPGTMLNTLDDLDLDLQLYNSTGAVLLIQSASHPAGEAEEIFRYAVQPAGDSFIVRISGTGSNDVQLYTLQFDLFNLSDPYLSVCPVLFDTLMLGSSATRITRFVNPAATVLSVYSVSVDLPFTVAPTGPQTIPAHDSLTLTIGYTADVIGVYTGNLTINHSGSGSPLTCVVNATAVTSWLQFIVSQDVNFGDVPLGESDSVRIPVRAQGNAPLTITSVSVAAPFSLNLSLPHTMDALSAVSLYPVFTPSALGFAEGTLVLFHTGTNSPDTLFLSGTCIPGFTDERNDAVPSVFRVRPNYPNPFNATTRIAFDLPRAARVGIQIFDINGRLVRDIAVEEFDAGRRSILFDASGLSSGVYLYRIATPEWNGIGKMMLLK